MIRLHSTKKLFAKLPVDQQGLLPSKELSSGAAPKTLEALNPLRGWHANLIMIQRRNCVLMVHDETRFTVFMPGLTKPDFARLEQHFLASLLDTLTALDASDDQIAAARKLVQPLVVDTQTNRSILGTLNQSKAMIEHIIWQDNASILQLDAAQLSAHLCSTPMLVTKPNSAVFPYRGMFALLDEASQSFSRSDNPQEGSTSIAKDSNVVSMADFLAAKNSK